MSPFRVARLATLCAAIMCSAGALHFSGNATASPHDVRFKSETFPLERMTAITGQPRP